DIILDDLPLTERKWRLFAFACLRRIRLTQFFGFDNRLERLLRVAEDLVDGITSPPIVQVEIDQITHDYRELHRQLQLRPVRPTPGDSGIDPAGAAAELVVAIPDLALSSTAAIFARRVIESTTNLAVLLSAPADIWDKQARLAFHAEQVVQLGYLD